ncbi:MAG TPA: M6 family metalloprotease domain-containing protein [Candidatus Eisenbacteria bacterium]|nr:M6 family metalloprotease domain-containing protein [Candidatus Eisenbacteria bacterium]
MRLLGVVLGVLFLAGTTCAHAAPPVQSWSEIAARRGPLAASRLRAALAATKPLGVDQASQTRLTGSAHFKALVILVQFSDHPADTLNHTPEDYDSLLFSVGTLPTGSMRDYYREVSRGAFDISGVVTRWYTAPRTYAEYASSAGGFGGPPFNAQQLAADAILMADADLNLTQFDNDGPDGVPNSGDDDGTIDGLFIVHAGPGGEETADLNDIWSHKWTLPNPYVSPDGVSAYPYTTEPEEWAGLAFATTPGQLISVGVFCHEYGHVLGLPDLYDTSGTSTANEGVGEWDLMGSGLYNHLPGQALGTTPCHFSAWSLARLGWVTPTWVTQDSLAVAIAPVETSDQVFRLWTNGQEDSEYFLIENRQPIGFDAALVRSSTESGNGASHGLLIYHIDEGVLGQSDPARKMVDVEEGGGSRTPSGFLGEQNLDLGSGQTATQTTCGGTPNVTGNRGDAYDPWPGAGDRTAFDGLSCPNSVRDCGNLATQVGVRNITESGGTITADLLVTGLMIRRETPAIDDSPTTGTPNNGNGLLESGETVLLRFPITNVGATPTGPLVGHVASLEPYLTIYSDAINYAPLAPGQTDSAAVVFADVNLAPDPGSAMVSFQLLGDFSQILADSFQMMIGDNTGICENFEGTSAHWYGVAIGCDGVNEWHRETGLGANHTGFGAWSWRLGPVGPVGSYAPSEDARLISPPILLPSASATLRFWQKYDCEFVFDGLWVEISTDAGATWTPLTPVGGYNTGDRYSGTRSTFTEAVFPLDGYSGIVQIAFHFVSVPPNGGSGWWIDDVTIDGTAPCAPVSVDVDRFTAVAEQNSNPPRVRLDWALSQGTSATVDLRRAIAGLDPVSIIRIPNFSGEGSAEDVNVVPGASYDYSLHVVRDGAPDVVAGPIRVDVPALAPPGAPRVFALAPVRPNPFRPEAGLVVSLDRDGPFMVRIYSPDGRLVRTMRFDSRPAGTHSIRWDGRDDHGRPASAGIYLFELRFGSRTSVQKAVLLR